MQLETYETPELVQLGDAEELVELSWSGPGLDILYLRYECGGDSAACPVD